MGFSRLRPCRGTSRALLLTAIGVVVFLPGVARVLPEAPEARRDASLPIPTAGKPAGCAADIAYPLRMVVTPLDPVEAGARVRARAEVVSDLPFDDAEIRILSTPGVGLLSRSRAPLGALRAGDSRSEEFEILMPPGRERRTVEVRVDAHRDGEIWTTAGILNLIVDEEPSRLVAGRDGEMILEIPARRLD